MVKGSYCYFTFLTKQGVMCRLIIGLNCYFISLFGLLEKSEMCTAEPHKDGRCILALVLWIFKKSLTNFKCRKNKVGYIEFLYSNAVCTISLAKHFLTYS